MFFSGSEQNLVHNNFSPISESAIKVGPSNRESPDKNMKKGTCTIRPKRRSRVSLHDLKLEKSLHSEFFHFPVFSTWILWEMFGTFFSFLTAIRKKHGTIGCFSQRKVDPKAAIFVWQLDHTQDWLQPEWLKIACFYVMVRILRCYSL